MTQQSPRLDSSRGHPTFDRRQSYSAFQPPVANQSNIRGGPIELPRPMEPRPTHQFHSPPADYASIPRTQDTASGHHRAPSDFRPNGQSLPGLKDILSPETHSSGYQWPSHNPGSGRPNGESNHDPNTWHRPLAFQPPLEPAHSYTSPPYRMEPGIPENSPARRHPAHSVPASPYANGPDSREPMDQRRGRLSMASTASYNTNGRVTSPYSSSGPEDNHYASPSSSFPQHHGSTSSGTGSGSENKKYVGKQNIPGEGEHYVYEDGSRCPTHINGERVVPEWGLTKANRPRKRLAQACLSCREKKIKCDPVVGPDPCVPCRKAKRPCIKPKGPAEKSTTSSNNTAASWSQKADSPNRRDSSYQGIPMNGDAEKETHNKRRMHDSTSPVTTLLKKYRSASPVDPSNGPENGHKTADPESQGTAFFTTGEKTLQLEEDPSMVDREVTTHLLNLYFMYVNNATYSLFPQHHFMRWAHASTSKSRSEKMVLYAVLAVGSIFADKQLQGFGKRCSQIAGHAVLQTSGRLTLFEAQTWFLLGIYQSSKGSEGATWDHLGSAIRACTSPRLRLNVEEGCVETTEGNSANSYEFSFTKEQLAECKRRTFWSCFIMDRYMDGNQCTINTEDVFVRLPCADDMYERGHRSDAPYFNNRIVDSLATILTPSSAISTMAWLALVAAIWGDVMNFTNRAPHRAESTYRNTYETFYAETHSALHGWLSKLPTHLTWSAANLNKSIDGGYAGLLISMHALYHFTLMKLNRCVRHRLVRDLVGRNIRAANFHAVTLLEMITTLRTARGIARGAGQEINFYTPFTGRIVMFAIDVAGAGGWDPQIVATVEGISNGVDILQELGNYWASAKDQHHECQRRYYQIQNILTRPFKARAGCWLGREWGVMDPLQREFGPEFDCIYGITEDEGKPNAVYFESMRMKDEQPVERRDENR